VLPSGESFLYALLAICHIAHYGQMQHHPQNRKYMTYCTELVREKPSHMLITTLCTFTGRPSNNIRKLPLYRVASDVKYLKL